MARENVSALMEGKFKFPSEQFLNKTVLFNISKVNEEKNNRYDFFYMNIVHTNKCDKKLQSPGALNIKETPGHKQKANVNNNNNNNNK